MRPRYSRTPSTRQRARSPVRYIRVPGSPYGFATNRSDVRPKRRRYPRASPVPAMYSSPATPTGTTCSPPSSTYNFVFEIGRPIGTIPAPCNGSLNVTHAVASVGPYAFTIRRPEDHRSTSSGEHASPPTTSVRSDSRGSPSKLPNTVGGINAWLTRALRSNSAKGSPTIGPGRGTTSAAPAAHAINTSITAASKLDDASCNTRDSDVRANCFLCAAARFGTPSCSTMTPFGVPVDPEV